MSGHSKWASIKHKKAAIDAKKGQAYTKIVREITVAARTGGGDINANPRLRVAVLKAKAVNMPADNVDRAIKKGTGELEGVTYEEFTMEGYGPGGAAVYLEVMTDNRNRTIADIRHFFEKYGGNLGANGCVSWLFERKGLIVVPASATSEDALFEIALEAGAEDVKKSDDVFEVITSPDTYEAVLKAINDKKIKEESAELTMIPKNTVALDDSKGKSMVKLIEVLDEHDDVQNVHTNADIPDSAMADA